MRRINLYSRKLINIINRRKLINNQFSLIASNCNGAFILHDLGLRFNSPFVNLYILPKDFIKLIRNIKEYMEMDLKEAFEEGISFPIGKLDDIKIYFMHYSSFSEAKAKWDQRKARINYDSLFVLFSDRDACSYDDLLEFDCIPIKNKVVFTHKPYSEIASAVYIHGFENDNQVGNCYEYVPGKIGTKYYDDFDYVSWFNSAINEEK